MLCAGFLVSPVHDKVFVGEALSRIRGFLGGVSDLGFVGGEPVFPEGCDGFLFFVLTGGTEELMLGARRASVGRPAVFLAHSTANSLAALLEASPILSGVSGTLTGYIGDLWGEAAGERILVYRGALEAVLRLRRSVLGVIGDPSPWLVYSRSTEECVSRRIGLRLTRIGLEELYRRYEETGQAKPLLPSEPVETSVPGEEVSKAYRLYLALKRLVEERGLDALTIRCFDVIRDLGTTACLPLALLNSEGIVAGCEGDVPAAIAMMIASYASGKPAFMANPSAVEGDRVLLAHCTAPLSMALEGYELKTHYETGMGVGVAARLRRGVEATVLRLAPGMDAARVFKATVVEGEPRSDRHCRTQVWLRVGFDPMLLLEKSMGNHHVLVLGDHVERLALALRLLGIRVQRL